MLDFLVDENLPLSAASILREHGHRARHVRQIGMRGARDEALFSKAQERSWIIVTRDLGFGNLLEHPLGTHAGIVILRLPSTLPAKQIDEVLESFISSVQPDTMRGALTVVEPDCYRIRQAGKD